MTHGIENDRFLQKWEGKALVGRPVLPCFPLYVSVKSSLMPPKDFMIYYVYVKIFIPIQPFPHQQVHFELTDNEGLPLPKKVLLFPLNQL